MGTEDSISREWSRELIGEIEIIISVLFFGVSFVLQRYAMLQDIGPLTYNAARFVVSTALLVTLGPTAGKFIHSEMEQEVDDGKTAEERSRNYTVELLKWGGLCGMSAIGGSILQQVGLVSLTAGKTGFITGMYVIFVPIMEYFIPGFGAHLNWKSWVAAFGSLFGLYLLSGCTQHDSCLSGSSGYGEIVVFISMLFWAVNIMLADVACKRVNVISLTTVDFSVVTVFTVIVAFVFEPQYMSFPFTAIRQNWFSILVVGFTEAVAFCLSTLGQMYTPPTRASILFSLEAVTCAILGFFALNERLGYVEILGAVFMAGSGLLADETVAEMEEEEVRSRAQSRVDVETAVTQVELPLWRDHKTFGSTEEIGYSRVALGDDKQ